MKAPDTKKLSLSTNIEAKEKIKKAMLDTYNESKGKKSFLASISMPRKSALIFGSFAMLLLGTILTTNLVRTPLSSERVIAGAIEALDASQNQGDWIFTKTKEEITYKDKTVTTYTESWLSNSDEASDDYSSSYKSTLLDGRILSEYVNVGGKSYERDTREVFKEIMGYSPYELSTSDEYLPPGFKEAGLTTEAFTELSMKEMDDALIAAGQKPLNSPMYKSLDFPAYSMKPAEIEALTNGYAGDPNSEEAMNFYTDLYGGDENMVILNTPVYSDDGKLLEGEEAESALNQQTENINLVESLRNGTASDKKDTLQKLQESKNFEINLETSWDGVKAISLSIKQNGVTPEMGTQTMYLDSKTFKIIGEEYVFDLSSTNFTDFMPENIVPLKVRITYLEEFYTFVKPSFPVDELVLSEDLYNSTTKSEPETQN